MPKLVVFRGEAVECEIALAGTNLRIGRDAQNDIVLDDPTSGVSRVHAEIRAAGGSYTIVDLGSRNGLWVNRKRVENAVLTFGKPVTLGAFELVLEDQVGPLEVDDPGTLREPVVAPKPKGTVPQSHDKFRTAPMAPPMSRASRQRLWLLSGAALVVIVAGIALSLPRRSKSTDLATIDVASAGLLEVQQPPPVNKIIVIVNDLLAAVYEIDHREFAVAIRDHLEPALQLDAEDLDALTLKAQAEAEMRKGRISLPPAVPKPVDVYVPTVSDIPRLVGESDGVYDGRVKRVQAAYALGRSQLEQKQFAAAIKSFEGVEHEQANYRDVKALIDTARQRSNDLLEAMRSAEENDRAGRLNVAWQWYRRAELYDATSEAADKAKSVLGRLRIECTTKFDNAENLRPFRTRWPQAIKIYQEIVEALPAGDELRDRALQRLQELK